MPAKSPKPASPPAPAKRASTFDIVTVRKVQPPAPAKVQRAARRGKTISLEQLRSKLGWK